MPAGRESLRTLCLIFSDTLRQRILGIPRREESDAASLCRAVLRGNAGPLLRAGEGHFHYLWVSDFGKSVRGAAVALPRDYLRSQLSLMLRHSIAAGHVTSCFSLRRGFDMPCARADNLPWLLFSLREYGEKAGDATLLEEHRRVLQALLDEYEKEHFDGELLGAWVTGDWMDSIRRPSSTYSNVCALKLLTDARALGFSTSHEPAAVAAALLQERCRQGMFTDYKGGEAAGIDAAVAALYFGLFEPPLRRGLIDFIEQSGLADPIPLVVAPRGYPESLMPWVTRLVSKYQSSVWVHMGLMYLNALKRQGKDVSSRRAAIEALFLRHGQVVEALDAHGRPYRNWLKCSEYGLTMAAGQYLELADNA